MITAVAHTLTDPLGRDHCCHGHRWQPETIRVDRAGTWHCNICTERSRLRHIERKMGGLYMRKGGRQAERNNPDPKPERARFVAMRLPAYIGHLRGEAAVKEIVLAFHMAMLHMPTILVVHPEQLCKYGDVTVREARDMEPLPSDPCVFYAR